MVSDVMKTAIQYKTHTPELSDGFYHKDCPVLYGQHDTITSLSECPFPLKTDSFEVLLWGNSKSFPDDKPEHGHTKRFAVVRFTKACGHTVEERISFIEGVKTFTHHGTEFKGESYSVNDWERRIEFFRNTRCDICGLVEHGRWIFGTGMGVNSRRLAVKRTLFLLNANYHNWPDFITEKEIVAKFAATKRGAE